MKCLRRTLFTLALLTLVAVNVTPLLAQNPYNPGIYQQYSAPVSSTLRFLASDAGKQLLLHSPSPMALPLLMKFHPDAIGQYPQQPMLQAGPLGGARLLPATVTGCGTASGTVMNLEPAAQAVGQREVSVDFLLSELGSGKDLVTETATDERGYFGSFDSETGIYVHRDGTVTCYGGTDFEMGNPPIADPFLSGSMMSGLGEAHVIADPNPAHKQFIFADLRFDDVTSGVGLRRVPASHFESTSTCPAGTLTASQEATCAGTTAILAAASQDNDTDAPAIAQDPRASGTGAGDIYVVNTSLRYLRSVILITACKATFATSADCSAPIIVSGSENETSFPNVAVLGGGPNAGAITITWMNEGVIEFASCRPAGAPTHPTCSHITTVASDPNLYENLTDNPGGRVETRPVIAARTDAAGQTIFVVWSDCKVSPFQYPLSGCPDADIVMATDTSITTPVFAFHHVATPAGHQIVPSIAYDSGQGITTIAYYTTRSDLYKNDVVMSMNQIPAGSITAGSTTSVTTSYDSSTGDGTVDVLGFENPLGDYMGLAARGGSASGSSRVYLGFTNNARLGTYGTVTNTQADNNISRVTY